MVWGVPEAAGKVAWKNPFPTIRIARARVSVNSKLQKMLSQLELGSDPTLGGSVAIREEPRPLETPSRQVSLMGKAVG